jgi:hypothetical protein
VETGTGRMDSFFWKNQLVVPRAEKIEMSSRGFMNSRGVGEKTCSASLYRLVVRASLMFISFESSPVIAVNLKTESAPSVLVTRTSLGHSPSVGIESSRDGCCSKLLRRIMRSSSVSVSNNFVRPGRKTSGDAVGELSADGVPQVLCFFGLLVILSSCSDGLDRRGDRMYFIDAVV